MRFLRGPFLLIGYLVVCSASAIALFVIFLLISVLSEILF